MSNDKPREVETVCYGWIDPGRIVEVRVRELATKEAAK